MTQRRIGPYDVISELGRGGMGVVYRARHRDLRREVALKVPLGEMSAKRRERFLREGQVTANLDHPGIVGIHEVGEAGGRPFLAYELVEHAEAIDRMWGPLAPEDRVRLIVQAARALGHAHSHGVVHRDIKAENLLIDKAGRVRVADFGVAQAQGLDRLTRTGQFVGTPSYAAPEQLFGERGEVGPASDVWSLGVVLYKALTGELPFSEQDTHLLAAQIMRSDPSSPNAVNALVSPALSKACVQALQKDIAKRPPHGDAFADLLEAALDPAPARSRPWALLIAAALAIFAGGVFAAVTSRGSAPQIAAAPADPEPSPVAVASPAESPGQLPREVRRTQVYGCGFSADLVWAGPERLWLADETRQVWCFRVDPSGGLDAPQRWILPEAEPDGCGRGLLEVGPDRAWLVTTGGVWEVTAGQEEPRRVVEAQVTSLAPGLAAGDVLAGGLDELILLDPERRLEPRRFAGPGRPAAARSVGALLRLVEGRYLALLKQGEGGNAELTGSEGLYLLAPGEPAVLLGWIPDAAAALALDAERQRCLLGTYGGRVTALSLETWQPIEHLRAEGSPEPDVATGYLPDAHNGSVTDLAVRGDRLYSVSTPRKSRRGRGELIAWSLAGVKITQLGSTQTASDGYRAVAVSPAGDWVAVARQDSVLELWPRGAWE